MTKTLPNECTRTICTGVLRKQTFVVYPSVEIKVAEDSYLAAVDALDGINNVFLSGVSIVLPEAENDAIRMLLDAFQGEIIRNDAGDKFATLAISEGVGSDLISLGSAIQEVSGLSAQEMVQAALLNTDIIRAQWKELYVSSMTEH